MILNDAQRAELEADVVQLCQELIQIPSVNFGEGKGDEEAAAKYVAAKLEEVGIKTKIYESAPKRCSVVARVEGSNPSLPGLVVHGHIDVVPANAADWSVDPFSGVIKDGCIYGPSAMKRRVEYSVHAGWPRSIPKSSQVAVKQSLKLEDSH